MKKLIGLIEKYGFACEAGPIEQCAEWIELKRLITDSHPNSRDLATEMHNTILRKL